MRLNHVDLQVSDVSEARRFFETHFGFQCTYQRGEEIALLKDEAGLSLGVSNLFASEAPMYPRDFHIGFTLPSAEDVRAQHKALKAAGLAIKSEHLEAQEKNPYIWFVCLGPDAIPIEVSAAENGA